MTYDITLRTDKIALSSRATVFKTESFVSLTRKVLAIDEFISRTAEGILRSAGEAEDGCYSAQTADGLYTLFVLKRTAEGGTELVFYGFINATAEEGGVDRGLKNYLAAHESVGMILRETDDKVNENDRLRLYIVSLAEGAVSFPHLNETQLKIVRTEDANMLVQGVAGSGKTNVCVEKIVYCACRNYRGRVLYTTFSRGLLSETRSRVELFGKNISDLVAAYDAGRIEFLDDGHKKAIENKLGVLFSVDEDGEIFAALRRIAAFLKEQVDYFLIEDIYAQRFDRRKVAGEREFVGEYLAAKNFRLSGALDRIRNIAPEIVYKEIYGMIYGKYEPDDPKPMMGREEYVEERRDSFTPRECEIIYSVAQDYGEYLRRNDYTDNNFMSRKLLGNLGAPLYSVAVVDEVQDFTQVNLCLIKALSRKMFCVGDALQMINPSYFNFGYLKRLMYGDVTGVSELRHNYRSSQRIERIAEKLGEMNISRFGTHSFVLKGESVPSAVSSEAVFVKDRNFVGALGDRRFENLTVIVGSLAKKEKLKGALGNMEVLTVAEAKGLERNTVILVDLLSDNADKWRRLAEMTLNRKTADENSVYRYYFNLFYVGASRARQHLFVAEGDHPKFFDRLFDECFERKTRDRAIAALRDIAGTIEISDDEFADRIEQFCTLEQYDNARSAAGRLSSEALRVRKLAYIDVHEKYLRYGNYRDAGVEYWRRGLDDEAREMFVKSGDEQLLRLMDACGRGGSALDPDIVRFYSLVEDNEVAKNLILDTLTKDVKDISAAFKEAGAQLRRRS